MLILKTLLVIISGCVLVCQSHPTKDEDHLENVDLGELTIFKLTVKAVECNVTAEDCDAKMVEEIKEEKIKEEEGELPGESTFLFKVDGDSDAAQSLALESHTGTEDGKKKNSFLDFGGYLALKNYKETNFGDRIPFPLNFQGSIFPDEDEELLEPQNKSSNRNGKDYHKAVNNMKSGEGISKSTVSTLIETSNETMGPTTPSLTTVLTTQEIITLGAITTTMTDVESSKNKTCFGVQELIYPVFGTCDQYIYCQCGNFENKICPNGLHFNVVTKKCDIPVNSKCSYSCPKTDGIFGVPGDCTGFIMCKNSIPEYYMCQPGKFWNKNKGYCDERENTLCPMQCKHQTGAFTYDNDYTSYILCNDNIPEYHKCPEGMNFDEDSLACIPGAQATYLTEDIQYVNQARMSQNKDGVTASLLRSMWSYLRSIHLCA